uniref:CapI n=1 Tax=Capnodium sp. TTI-000886 TaxID=3078996 RepID=A0AA96MHV1_9PEZI|nr:CapI [Capnodium sp. TTI-000886]
MANNILASFFPPDPWAYSWLLRVFQWLPVTTVGMWMTDYHPCGKFSRTQGFNINGRLAWCLMESVGPAHMLYVLRTLSVRLSIEELPLWNKVAAALYVIHYINRAWIGPLFVAPSMSPVGVEIFAIVSFHNWYNTAILTPWIAGYETPISGYPGLTTIASEPWLDGARQYIPCIGLGIFALGMTNNILAERRLWSMRKEEAQRRLSATKSEKGSSSSPKNMYAKVYVMPPANGLFRHSLYPHYFWEWIEWFGYVLVGTAVATPKVGQAMSLAQFKTPSVSVAPWIMPLASLAEKLGVPLPLPPLAFVLNFVACMLPQARRGLRWYKQRFSEQAVAGRSAIVPGIPFW